MPFRGIIAVAIVKRIESKVADQGFWLQTDRAIKAFSYNRAGKPAVITLDITAVSHLIARSYMNNILFRESIWWDYIIGSMLIRRAKRKRFLGFVLSFWLFETIQNCRLAAIAVQHYICFSTTSCGRQELNKCSYTLKLNFVKFSKSFGAALANKDPKLAPKESLTFFFQF
jgi:hypothetical protein